MNNLFSPNDFSVKCTLVPNTEFCKLFHKKPPPMKLQTSLDTKQPQYFTHRLSFLDKYVAKTDKSTCTSFSASIFHSECVC